MGDSELALPTEMTGGFFATVVDMANGGLGLKDGDADADADRDAASRGSAVEVGELL